MPSIWQRTGLSGKLLLLTICFVMLSEFLILVPSLGNFWKNRLQDHIEASHIAVLALEAAPREINEDIGMMILEEAGVSLVALRRQEQRQLILGMEHPESIRSSVDLSAPANLSAIAHAFQTLFSRGEGMIQVTGTTGENDEEKLEIIIDQAPLRVALLKFTGRIFALSLIISALTAAAVFFTINRLMVRPTQRLTANMVAFRETPENAELVMKPTPRSDEIGIMERELALLQTKIRADLRQRGKLAALGLAVSKINHDLRNMLASAQLISDRLGEVQDPDTSRLAPRLIESIDRAIALCTQTLRFGKEEEREPQRIWFELRPLAQEAGRSVGITEASGILWENRIDDGLRIYGDSEQIFRILMNLGRNAVQAMEAAGRSGAIALSAQRLSDKIEIDVKDEGPGVPDELRAWLENDDAAPLSGRIGLGLAITRELARLHGGEVVLARSDAHGSCFRVSLPQPASA